jgi:hypothetical protein
MSGNRAAAPAIPLDTLLPLLTQHCLDPRTARILERDENFRTLQYRCHQIFSVHDFLVSQLQIPVSISALAAGFGCSRDPVKKVLLHGLELPETRGRHLALSDKVEQEFTNRIEANAAKSRVVTSRDMREHVMTQYSLSVTRGWVNSFMSRHMDELCNIKNVPQRGKRLEDPRCFLDETVPCITQFVHGLPTELVFNLDEVGISDWEDRTSKSVIVPKAIRSETIHHKIHRNLKHVSVIVCVSAAGESLIPYIVTSQDSLPVRENLKRRGVRFGTD